MSFLNPLFFWGMLAASVPVLLHLIRRERTRKLEFSDRVMARSQLISDKGSILGQLEHGVSLSDLPTRYGQALKVAEKLALEAGTDKRVIHLISDFQKSGWSAGELDSRLSSLVEIRAVDVGSDTFSNIAFGEVQVLEEDNSTGGGFKIKAAVVNFGTQDRKGVRASLQLDGRVVSEKLLDLAKSAAQGVEFQIPGLTPGIHPIVLEVNDANLTRDNRFSMTLEARGKTPVLSVENPGSGRSGRSPSFFLAHALNISTLSPYRLTTISPQKAGSVGSFSGSLLIWNNAPGGTPYTQKKLEEFVKEGGGLIVVLGDAVSSSDFNGFFGAWIPVKIEASSRHAARPAQASRASQDYALLTDVRMDHPVFRPFSEPHSGSFSTAKFFQYARLAAGQGSEVLARFDNGYPALVCANI